MVGQTGRPDMPRAEGTLGLHIIDSFTKDAHVQMSIVGARFKGCLAFSAEFITVLSWP